MAARVVVIQGARGVEDVPGLAEISSSLELRFANTDEELARAFQGAEVMLGWDFRAAAVRRAWGSADRLRWIHWGGAGVDALLFDELVQGSVLVTNSRGVFDRPMAEYVLGLIIAFTKRLHETWTLQTSSTWKHRLTDCIEGQRALVVGVGGIGRAIARLCTAAGLEVRGIGRREREDPDFNQIYAQADLDRELPWADFVICVAPLTASTRGLFGARQFERMKNSARLINVGRGASLDEPALTKAVLDEQIAGAALDVFADEPLASGSPLWDLPGVIISPHMSGDFNGYEDRVAEIFFDNLSRYEAGEPLRNIVDKQLGFVAE